ncbi:hypothetical protein acsn021_10950 [Anaerocolumna cellulosilytica]|uniref:Uncharacterized protein n=1 Tax=Anaerocolumna cellulosilytica TaxID=433286 RepID=A0A6S6QV18_9FIRM|nr:hypothetical protein [Anaerocolumna cellulosilytica]MBB5194582.1 hypothetical protein [Anaerocolumna cellulosilytica]BCJ93526.1 hypothetical protein acsn021_10950 [Anaerocolumna cellulosilytica]
MNVEDLNKVIGAVGNEKMAIHFVLREMGFEYLMEHANDLPISNKTQVSLLHLDEVLKNPDNMKSLSHLTEIPINVLKQCNSSHADFIINHPERINIDFRQLEKLRALKGVFESYQLEEDIVSKHEDVLETDR